MDVTRSSYGYPGKKGGREGVSCKCFDHSPPKRLVFLPAPDPEEREGEREGRKAISAFVTEKRKFGDDCPISETKERKKDRKGEKGKKLMKIFPMRDRHALTRSHEKRSEFTDGVPTNRFIDTRT